MRGGVTTRSGRTTRAKSVIRSASKNVEKAASKEAEVARASKSASKSLRRASQEIRHAAAELPAWPKAFNNGRYVPNHIRRSQILRRQEAMMRRVMH